SSTTLANAISPSFGLTNAMSTSVTCMVATSFVIIPVNLSQQSNKAREIAGGFHCLVSDQGELAQGAEPRSQVIVERWSYQSHARNMEANRGVNSRVGCRKLGRKTGPMSGMVLSSRRTVPLGKQTNSLSLKWIKGWAGYSLPGVFGAPPFVSQLAI